MKPCLPWFLNSSKNFKAGCAALFALPFFAGGLFCLWSLTLRPTFDWVRSRSWQETEAVINKAWLEESGGGSSRRRSVHVAVEYRYRHHGTWHAGKRYSFVSGSTNIGVGGMNQVVRDLQPDKTVACWVNPADPREAVLDRSLPTQAVIGLFFATPFITVGVAGLGTLALPSLRRRFIAKRKAQLHALVLDGKLPDWVLCPLEDKAFSEETGIALVISPDERLPLALGVTFLNLFWNGLVGAFVCVDVISIANGEGGTGFFLSLFLTPFVAVGCVFFWSAIKLWVQTRRPGWVAAMSPVPDFQGGEASFCWAWLDARRHSRQPQAGVRLVAQAAHWDDESNSATRMRWQKRSAKLSDPDVSRKSEFELAAVEIPDVDASCELALLLPQVPPPPARSGKSSRRIPKPAWGGWWQLEVTHDDGEIETADLTEEQKLSPLL